MRLLALSRGEAEELVDILECDAGCGTRDRKPSHAISEEDWRLRVATDLREQWGMTDRRTEANVRGTILREPGKPN